MKNLSVENIQRDNEWELDNQDNPKFVRLQEFLSLVLQKSPPLSMIADYELHRSEELQQFVLEHLRKEIQWSTGIGLIEAAQNIIQAGHLVLAEAIGNGNLLDDGTDPNNKNYKGKLCRGTL